MQEKQTLQTTDVPRGSAGTVEAPDAVEILANVATAVASERDLARIVAIALEHAPAALGAPVVCVHVAAASGEALTLAGERGVPAPVLAQLRQLELDAAIPTATAARTQRIQTASDLDTPPAASNGLARQILSLSGCRSLVAVPLCAGGRTVGVLTCALRDATVLGAAELRLLRALGGILGAGVARAQVNEREGALRAQLEAAQQAALAIGSERGLDDTLQRIVDEARNVGGARYAAIGILGETPEAPFAPWLTSGMTAAQLAMIGAPARPFGLLAAPLREQRSVRVVGLADDPAFAAATAVGHPSMGSLLAVPVMHRGRAIGCLYLADKLGAEAFSDDDQRAMELLAQHASLAIDRARQHDQMAHEIAERARAQAALAHSEERMRSVLENATDAIFLADLDGRYTDVNPAGCRLLGFRREEIVGKTIADLIPPEELPHLAAARARMLAGETDIEEWTMVRKDGARITVEVGSRQLPDGRWQGMVHDVSARRRALDELHQSEERFRLAIDYAPIGKALVALDGTFIRVNAALCEMLGYTAAELLGLRFQDITHPDDLSMDLGLAERLRAGQIPRYSLPKRYVRKDGSVVHTVLHGSVVRDARGQPLHFIAQIVDETQRIAAERARDELTARIEAERTWLRAVIDRSPIGIVLVQGAGGERFTANARLEELYGFAVGSHFDVARFAHVVRRADGSELPIDQFPSRRALRGEVLTREPIRIRRGDGSLLPVEITAGPIRDAAGAITGAVVLVEDVTAQTDLARLRDEWISVIAHDLRQPISAINMQAALLRRMSTDEPTRRAAEHILASARRENRMVADLQDYSLLEAHRMTLRRERADLVPLTRAVVERAAGEARGRPLHLRVATATADAEVDPQRFEQVLANLVSNAAKYGEEGTDIAVALERCGEHARVSVTNRGSGIGPEDVHRLFDRFQRTSAARQSGVVGLGLGLYITRGLVEAHGGKIWVESTPGETTTFRFTIPLAASDGAVDEAAPHDRGAMSG